MCGIFFYYGTSFKLEELKKNFILISHRGPDDTSEPFHIGSNSIMGFHRLSINGLNSSSNQPLIKDNVYLICNGEIYFHDKLEKKFGLETTTESDCEVILSMYIKFGIDKTVRYLRGEFSFVLVDLRNSDPLIYAVRDSFGKRQLYYSDNKDGFLLASEAKGIMKLGKKSVKAFPPRNYYDVVNKKFTKYYTVGQKPDPVYDEVSIILSDIKTNHIEKVYKLFQRACHEYVTMTDRPIAALESGGFDSTAVISLSKQVKKDINIYSTGMKGSHDVIAARKAAEFFDLKLTVTEFTLKKGIINLKRLIYHLETPDVTTIRAGMPMMLLIDEIPEPIVLSGEGLDEVFSGYMENFLAPSSKALH
jgi:asparagine synthase (glutamine-hydrolysing)